MIDNLTILQLLHFKNTTDWNIKQLLRDTNIKSSYPMKPIGAAIRRVKDQMVVEDDKKYKRITIKINGGGVTVRDEVEGKEIKTKQQYYIKSGQLAVSKIDARNGAFGIVPSEADGAIITGNFWVFDVIEDVANIEYLIRVLSSERFVQAWLECSNGSGNRLYLQEKKFLNYKIPMPSIDKQRALINSFNNYLTEAKHLKKKALNIYEEREKCLNNELGIRYDKTKLKGNFGIVNYQSVSRWDPQFLVNNITIKSNEKLSSIASFIDHFMVDEYGNSLRFDSQKEKDSVFLYVGMENIEKHTGQISFENKSGKEIFSQTVRVPNGYVLYGKLRPYLNKYWYNNTSYNNIICSSEFFVFNTKGINKDYFLEVLSSNIIQNQIHYLYSGARMPRINENDFKSLLIPVPSKEVQEEIVNNIFVLRENQKCLREKAKALRKQACREFEEAVFGE